MRLRFISVIVGVVLLVLVAQNFPIASHVANTERERLTTTLERDAYVLSGRMYPLLLSPTPTLRADSAVELQAFFNVSDATAIVTDKNGYLLASTSSSDLVGEDYASRPEISAALFGSFESGIRTSKTLGESLVFVAVPVFSGDEVIGVVRLTYPKSTIDKRVSSRVRTLLVAATMSVLIAIFAAILLASIIARPIIKLRNATDQINIGNLSTPITEDGPNEIRQLARSFNAMTLRVRKMLDLQRSFSGDAAHQMRTPLTALRLRLEQAFELLESPNLNNNSEAVIRDHLEAALNESDRLTILTEQLLRLARSEGSVLEISKVELRDLIAELCGEWSYLAAEKNVTIENQVEKNIYCMTSRLALREILGNYIDNAIGHSPDNAKIMLLLDEDAELIIITVRDQGKGLGAEQREKAFDRFWRGADQLHTSNSQGSGLGLAIASQLASASNIELELAPSPNLPGLDARVKIKLN